MESVYLQKKKNYINLTIHWKYADTLYFTSE